MDTARPSRFAIDARTASVSNDVRPALAALGHGHATVRGVSCRSTVCTEPASNGQIAVEQRWNRARAALQILQRQEPAMHPYPHVYTAAASGRPEGTVAGLRQICRRSQRPHPLSSTDQATCGHRRHCCARIDCGLLRPDLSRNCARLQNSNGAELGCRVEGVLERVDGVAQYTRFTTFASLKVTSDSDAVKVQKGSSRRPSTCVWFPTRCVGSDT